MSIIDVRKFTFAYPDKKERLHEIDLSIGAGEFVLLCGPSGSGKTTLLRSMKPQIAPVGRRSGTITELPAEEIGFVFQNPDNQIVMDTVRHELAFGLENMGLDSGMIRRRVAETALFFGIDEWIDASVHEISGGQKQLLNLASVIAMRPKILLLDEPISQLDPSARKNFLELLVRVNRELGIAVLLSEHHLEEVLPLADRVYYLESGRIAYQGNADEYVRSVFAQGNSYQKTFPAAARIAEAVRLCVYDEGDEGKYFHGAEENIHYPLTVKEGRDFLNDYVKNDRNSNEKIAKETQCFLPPIREKEERDVCLHVDHIWFQYHKQTPYVLKGLDIIVKRGEFHTILGGNGSGKSTLLSILGKRIYADRGKIRLGKDKIMPAIALLTQNPKAMFSRDSVKEELEAVGCSDTLIRELELEKLLIQHPYDLSGGEQQRLGLALVMSKNPDLLLLDEPAKGLDIEARQKLGEYLRNYTKKGHTVLCVTHDVEFASTYADVCSLLFEGEILSTDQTRTFFMDNAFYTTDAIRVLRSFL